MAYRKTVRKSGEKKKVRGGLKNSKRASLKKGRRATRKGGLKDVKLAKMGEKSQTPKPQSKKRVSGHDAEAAASCIGGVCRGLGALLSGGKRRTKRAGLRRSKKGGLKRGGRMQYSNMLKNDMLNIRPTVSESIRQKEGPPTLGSY